MEITYTQNQSYSLELDAKAKRELADHLDITVRQLNKLVAVGELYDEHADALIDWVSKNSGNAQVTSHEDIEIEEITG